MNRRRFLSDSLRALAGLAGLLSISFWSKLQMGCGTEISGGQCTGSFTNQHSSSQGLHTVSVTQSDIDAGVAKQFTLEGSDHNHTINLTAAQLATLGSGGSISTNSSFDEDHDHVVTISAC